MEFIGGSNNSLFKVLSSKKSPDNRAAIRRKLEKIRQKLRSGARLTSAEKEFLRRYAPQLYEQAMAIERERAAYEERLKQCRTEEELERVKLEKMAEMAALEEKDEEMVMVRMAQMEDAEKEAIKERQIIDEKLEAERLTEEFEEESWDAEEGGWYEEEIEGEYWQEDYEDAGIYGPLRYKGADADTKDYKEPFGRIANPRRQEGAFTRGHAAYRKAAEEAAWIEEDIVGNETEVWEEEDLANRSEIWEDVEDTPSHEQ